MTFFANRESGKHYVSLFYSRKSTSDCRGVLFTLSDQGVRLSSSLPALAIGMGLSTVIGVLAWLDEIFASYTPTNDRLYIGLLTSSVVIAVITAILVSYSQVHAVKNDDYVYGGDRCILQIDWTRSISLFSINVLFGINGILITLWVSRSEIHNAAISSVNSFDLTLAGFGILALPGLFRLVWLFKLRGAGAVRWGNNTSTK
jgi:hypothetical protein